MHKLAHYVGDGWIEHSYPALFERRVLSTGTERLTAGVPAGDPLVFARLVEQMPSPYFLLYVLHTPRGEADEGRYQSPEMDWPQVSAFLQEFGAFLSGDARHDTWAYSPDANATVVWDRHNLIHAYGDLDRFESALRALGFSEGELPPLGEHTHYYRSEYDDDARRLIAALDWHHTPLRPEDEQG